MPYGSSWSANHTKQQRTLVMIRPEFPPEESEKQPTHSQRRLGLEPTRSGASNHYTTTTTGTGASRRTLARTETNGPGTDPGEPGHEERGGEQLTISEVGGRRRAKRGDGGDGEREREGGLRFEWRDRGEAAADGRFDAVGRRVFFPLLLRVLVWCETRWVDWLTSRRGGRRIAPWTVWMGAGPGGRDVFVELCHYVSVFFFARIELWREEKKKTASKSKRVQLLA
jgi:hypothetical protein